MTTKAFPLRRPSARAKTRGGEQIVQIRTGNRLLEFRLADLPDLIDRLTELEKDADASYGEGDDDGQPELPLIV